MVRHGATWCDAFEFSRVVSHNRRLKVHPRGWNGVTSRLPGTEAHGYVRTPFHGGRSAGWKVVNSLTAKSRLNRQAAHLVK